MTTAHFPEGDDEIHLPLIPEPYDDDGDDDEEPADGESFDGGYGQGSYFQHAMRKDD